MKKVIEILIAIKKFLILIGNKIGIALNATLKFLKGNPVSRFLVSSKGIKVIVFVGFIIGIIELVFAVLIYGFHSTDKVTRIAAKVVPYPAAVVNQSFISYNEYLRERDYIHHFYNSTGQADLDYKAIDAEIINQLAENKLLSLQAFLYGEKVSKVEVNSTLDQIIEQNGGQDQVEKVLSDLYGLNIEQFKKLIRTQILRDNINKKLIMRVTARHILVRADENVVPEKVAETKTKIEGIKTEIQNGLDFSEAAKKYSEDTGSAENGGLLESFAKGEMVEEFSNVAFSAEVGKVSDPVKTSFGWHIIKVEERTGKIDNNFTDWLAGLKKDSLIIKFVK
jgi:parvulin-like peptidyl-prolyl isomerase